MGRSVHISLLQDRQTGEIINITAPIAYLLTCF